MAKASPVSELQALDVRYMQRKPDGVLFLLTQATKTQGGGGPRALFIPSLDEDPFLYPVRCLSQYFTCTETNPSSQDESDPLLLAINRQHRGASTHTVSRWLKAALGKGGVDTTRFGGHSTRGASTTPALARGVSMADVLAAADWSRPSTFITHYYRPQALNNFTHAVLSHKE